MANIKNRVGQKFGLLTCISMYRTESITFLVCECECGKVKTYRGANVINGQSKSCGCWRQKFPQKKPWISKRNKLRSTHNMSQTRSYNIWRGMKQRCLNDKCKDFANYGGREITICESWLKFENFLSDMGEAPKKMQLDRIDNDGKYCKENCRWTSTSVQGNNKRTNVFIEYGGERKTIADWSRAVGLERKTLEYRIRIGWDHKKALTTPSLINRRNKNV
jgi:hypothetical protein